MSNSNIISSNDTNSSTDTNVAIQRDNIAIQRLTKEERETILTYNEADGYWEIYTGVQSHIRKFDKRNYEVTEVDYYPNGEIAGKFYKVPKNAISFKDPTKKRNISDEQKAMLAERMRNIKRK